MKVKIIDEKIQKSIDELVYKVYERGYDDGYKVIPSVYYDNYEKGLNDAWECAGKIMLCEAKGGFSTDKYTEIFGNIATFQVLETLSASEAISAIKEYEEQQKQKLIANCITCKWDYRNYEKYLNVSEDEKVRHCNECYKNSGYELMSTEMKSCSILGDDCPYDIKCEECEVHCSVERAKQKLKGDKE